MPPPIMQVGALVEEKRIKLEDGFQHAHQFDKHFKELSSWVQEAEAQVTWVDLCR